MNDLTLYGMVSELSQIEQLMNEDEFFEDSEENQALIAKRSQELVKLLTDKTDSTCGYAQSIDDYIYAIDKRIDELNSLKEKTISKRNKFHSYVLCAMDRLGISKINGKFFSISYRKPTISSSVNIIDENLIPSSYIKRIETVSFDKRKMLADLKDGRIIDGATLIHKKGDRNLVFKVV